MFWIPTATVWITVLLVSTTTSQAANDTTPITNSATTDAFLWQQWIIVPCTQTCGTNVTTVGTLVRLREVPNNDGAGCKPEQETKIIPCNVTECYKPLLDIDITSLLIGVGGGVVTMGIMAAMVIGCICCRYRRILRRQDEKMGGYSTACKDVNRSSAHIYACADCKEEDPDYVNGGFATTITTL